MTPGLDVLLDDQEQAKLVERIPRERMGTPDDLAKAALFLAFDDSAYITSIEPMVDGGVA